MRSSMLAAVLVLTALSASAEARPGKSHTVALALGGVGTAVSAGLILTSALMSTKSGDVVNVPLFSVGFATSIVTPSLGQYYAGDYLTIGMGIRAASAVLAEVGIKYGSETHRCNLDEQCTNLTQRGVVIIGLAAIGFIAGVAYDIGATTDSVDAYNRKHGIFMGVARAADEKLTPLVGIQGRF